MTIFRLGQNAPEIAASAYVAPGAFVIGKVTLAEGSSVWFNAVVRGDNEPIHVGARSNIQEGAVLHTDPGRPLLIGQNVTIGHQAMLHGCTIGDGSLIGIQAVVLNGAVIGKNCLVGAGSIVTEGKIFPDNSLILGSPAKVVRALTEDQCVALGDSAQSYVDRALRFKEDVVEIHERSEPR